MNLFLCLEAQDIFVLLSNLLQSAKGAHIQVHADFALGHMEFHLADGKSVALFFSTRTERVQKQQ